MCSNTGDPKLLFHSLDELLRRVSFVRSAGFSRVVVTGGEPTIHPGFWSIVEQLAAFAIEWDINTHGRSFAVPGFAERAVSLGLKRAIVSLHSHDAATSAAIFGTSEQNHSLSVQGIRRLLDAGVMMMANCVINQLNLDQLETYTQKSWELFGDRIALKFVFPSTLGKGGRWPAIAGLRYADVRAPIRRVHALADELGLRVFFESIPHCIVGCREGVNLGRSAFGETHYLEDDGGDRIYAMRAIEADLFVFAEVCRSCPVSRRCSGVAQTYAARHGVEELEPFSID